MRDGSAWKAPTTASRAPRRNSVDIPDRFGTLVLYMPGLPGLPAAFAGVSTGSVQTYGYDALAADGRIIRLRPVSSQDGPALRDLYAHASDESRHRRFLSLGSQPVESEVRRLIRPAGADHEVCVAGHGDRIIGVAACERLPGTDQGDFAVLVADDWHGNGVGTLLLEQLASLAQRQGINRLVGEMLRGNTPMLQVVRGLSPDAHLESEVDLTFISIDTRPGEAALAAQDLRERIAEGRSLGPLLRPEVVVVVGAGRRPGGIGHELLRSIAGQGFTGRLYAANPHATQVAGVASFPSIAAIPDHVDLVVVAVPAPHVLEVIEDAGVAGARAAVIISSGFSETGEQGRRMQASLLRAARAHGIRLVGPNCLGVLNTDPGVRLAATFSTITFDEPHTGTAASHITPGGLAVASQSGAVGIAILDHAARAGAGISTFVSLGNKADISGNDLLSYWYDDPATTAVALYLESFGNPRKFARIARAVARRKPVLAVKSGRSQSGRRAGASHTAAAAAPDVAVDSLFAQAGVVRTETLGDLLDAARLLTEQPLPTGTRIGILGNAGGMNVLAADAAEAAGLTVPDLSDEGGNPLDLGAGATADALTGAVRRLANGGHVDALLVIFGATLANDAADALAALADAVAGAEGLPVAVVLVGVADAPTMLGGAPVFDLPERAIRALGHAARYAGWRRAPLGRRPDLPGIDADRGRKLVGAAIDAGGGWLGEPLITQLLACYGIPMISSTVAHSMRSAVEAASFTGFPVVVKAADPELVHKSDRGLVRLGLTDTAAVAEAYLAIADELGEPSPNVLVQPMRPGGVELVAGVVHDPLFGSLVMAGLGGVHTDLIADRGFRLLPLTDRDAGELWRGLRGAPLLTGYRGSLPVDTAAVEDLLCRVGRLAEDLPEVAELDLNPVLAFPDGVVAVDVKLRLAAVGAEPDPTLRVLRGAS